MGAVTTLGGMMVNTSDVLPQTILIYNTLSATGFVDGGFIQSATSPGGYERASIGWTDTTAGSAFTISTQISGNGLGRDITLKPASAVNVTGNLTVTNNFSAAGTSYFNLISAVSGVFTQFVTNTNVTTNVVNTVSSISARDVYAQYLSAYNTVLYNGMYATGQYGSGPYSDGIVIDYIHPQGRISVGPSDSLVFYTGGVGTTKTFTISSNGDARVTGGLTALSGIQTKGDIVTTLGSISAGNNICATGYIGAGGYIQNNVGGGINSLKLVNNRIENHEYNVASCIQVNYVGYNASTSQFRDFAVYDGKQNQILRVDGAGGRVLASCICTSGVLTAANFAFIGAGGDPRNLALGADALASNTTGSYNVALGPQAMCLNTTGYCNIGIGKSALSTNLTGFGNVAIGAYAAGFSRGFENVAVGSEALKTASGYKNTAVGSYALNQTSSGCYNIGVGGNAGYSNTTGNRNVAIGGGALFFNSTGSENVAIGTCSLYYTCPGPLGGARGSGNVGVGACTLVLNTIGFCNAAIGASSMYFNCCGSYNIAIGNYSLFNNVSGSCNAAIGNYAMGYGCGSDNVAIGNCALYQCSNYPVGLNKLDACRNVVIGSGASYGATYACDNVVIGYKAGCALTTGCNNVLIGCCTGAGGTGMPTITTQNNYIVLGNASTLAACIKPAAWTYGSDCRDKANISYCVPYGLGFVNALRPVTFQQKCCRTESTPAPDAPVRYGFLAQDILSLENKPSVIIDSHNPDSLGLNSDALIPVLVNAIKELTARVEALEKR